MIGTAVDFGMTGIFFFLLAVFGIAVTGFWIWTIVDCVQNERSDGNDKLVWILIIVLAGWIGSLIYVFVRRPARIREFGQ